MQVGVVLGTLTALPVVRRLLAQPRPAAGVRAAP